MSELKLPISLKLASGGSIKVLKELGRGGQGIVYLCEYNKQKYALKWYTQSYPDTFYKNLEQNIANGSPNKSFLWPIAITEKQLGSFGYVMNLIPSNYYDFGDILLAKSKFKTLNACITSAFQICEGFYDLHLKGYSYQDLNDGNFFMDTQTGNVLICDNDNITAQGDNLGIAGKMRYMAPEIVLGEKPDKYSDYFSLSVILFMLFFKNHPLEGNATLSAPCMTEVYEKKFFGTEPIFIFDRDNKTNRPVNGVHHNVIRLWPEFPSFFKEFFEEAFSKVCFKDKTKRPLVSKWQKILVELRNNLLIDENGDEFFLKNDKQAQFYIETDIEGTIALSPKKTVYIGKNNEPTALVWSNKIDPSAFSLQNISNQKWIVETPSGKLKHVEHNEIMPTKKGLKITFSPKNIGTIV